MQRTAITVNYLQMLCLLVVLFFFLQRVALIVVVLLSSKSLLWLLGYCFLRRVYFVCWGACLLAFFKELLCMLCYLLLAFWLFGFLHHLCEVPGAVMVVSAWRDLGTAKTVTRVP